MAALAVVTSNAPQALGQVTYDFEPPTYIAGNLVGQDGWIKNTYYGDVNGAVTVSTTTPLGGAQSISYVEATAGGLSDVGRLGAIAVQDIQGTDVTLSYTIKGTAGVSGPNSGVFLGNGAPFGASPIFARLNGGVVEVGSAGGFVPVNSFFFSPGEAIKMTYEIDFGVGSMNLILENLVGGEVFSQAYPFFAPYGAPTGPNGEYNVDLGIFFRGGNVSVDDITLTAGVGPIESNFEWTANATGNWNQTTNWTPTGIPGTIPGRQNVTLGSAITAARTIYNNEVRNINSLTLNNANSYIVAGVGTLAFQSDTSGATTIAPKVTVTSGAHQIQLAVELLNDTSVTAASGASLDFNNVIDLNGHVLTTSGAVRFNHSTIGGGAVMSIGSLEAESVASFGGDLTSTGTMLVNVDENGSSFYQVAGDAMLSGTLDVVWSASSLPSDALTVLTAGGSLDASALVLSPEDRRSFSLGTDGNNLKLTFLGVAVPEPTSVGMLVIAAMGLTLIRGRQTYARGVACGLAAVALAGTAAPVLAISYNFENPPYTPGNIIGQQNWNTPGYVLADPFFGGVVNGTTTVSAVSPIGGAQSLLYSQTVDPPLAGNTGAADVSRANAVFAKKDGTPANDLTASFQIRTDANSIGSGSAGFFLGRAGSSPIFVLITDASSTAGTGSVLIGDNAAFATSTYVANSVYEYTFGVDVDSATYEVTSRNITAGTPAQTLTGSGPNGRFVFLGGGYASDGDNQTYTFDTSVLLRSGEARIDNITAVGDDFTEALWGGGSGSWATNASWIPNIAPNVTTGNAPIAVFGSRITSPQTVVTGATQTVNGLRFDNANKYAISGPGAVALKANTVGGTVDPTINVVSGAHELQTQVSILDNTTITVAAGAQLDFNNAVALGGKTLATGGAVNLNYGVTGGGSITNTGVLGTAGTTPIVANLASTGTLAFDLGLANRDFFNITGNATLSGLVDITLEPNFVPTGSYTLLTVSGTLNAAGLALVPSDAAQFSLGVTGKSLVLTVGGSTAIPGDFNGNGAVDGADLAKWKTDFGAGAGSDANGDGRSDGADFLIWQRNFGQSSAVTASAAVPEPASVAIAAIACVGGIFFRRRSTR
jgi:hypothetical protein